MKTCIFKFNSRVLFWRTCLSTVVNETRVQEAIV